MCSGARPDDLHDAHHRARQRGALDVNDLIVVADAQINSLAERLVQRMHVRQRFLAHVDARFHQVAELEQPYAEAVRPGLDAIDEAAVDHHAQDAVRGRRVERGLRCELLQVDRGRMPRERIEQRHHALDDLDGRLCFFESHGRMRQSGGHDFIRRNMQGQQLPSRTMRRRPRPPWLN